MKTKSMAFALLLFISTLIVFITNGCHGVYLDETKAASEVKSMSIYIGIHKDKYRKTLDEALVKSFAKDYALNAEIKIYDSYKKLEDDFKTNQIHIAIARTSARHSRIFSLQGPAYDDLQVSLFCNSQNIKSIYIPEKLKFIQKEFIQSYPEAKDKLLITDDNFETLVNKSFQIKHSCLFAESKYAKNAILVSKKYQKTWTTQNIYPMSWLIRYDQDDLNKLVNIWFQKLMRENRMVRFKDQYDAPFYKMDIIEYKSFKSDVKNKLPEWKKYFIEYSEKYQIPWTLIAAVAYQESKWQADAKSHTGVKGFMQLTSETAQHLGVEDREDPIQSIQGGSYYLKYLYDKTPQRLTRFERWIQALAAYNVGYAHLKDIHRLAKTQNTDSYRWINLKNLLPELSNKENLEIFQYGLARGEETVEFIENVLNYHEALNHIFTQRSQTSRDF